MKQILLAALVVIIVGFSILYIYANFFSMRDKSHDCGGWSPFGGIEGNPPTCDCDGTIVRKGGPTGPADDSGGWYECDGTIRGTIKEKR